jgi:hypothetical protein
MDKTTVRRSFRLAVAVGAILVLVIAGGAAWEWWQSHRLPSREPDLRGRLINAGPAGFLVESPAGGQCWVRPPVSTRIRTGSDESGALAVGQTVSVWHTSLVRESFPPQVDATWIVIEEDKP